MFVWPKGDTEIEYGYLDLDNHILYKDGSNNLNDRLDEIARNNHASHWVVAFNEDMSQCIYGFSVDCIRLGFNISASTVYAVINRMKKHGAIERI